MFDGLKTVLAKINANQMPVEIDHLNVHPKHNVISLMMPQVAIQLTVYASITSIINPMISKMLPDILSFNLLIVAPLY